MNHTPTILLSGWAHRRASLAPLAKKIAPPDATVCLALDELAGDEETPRGLSPLAASLLARIGETATRVELVGWSTGAMVALEAARWAPERIARLILISGTAKFCADDAWTWGVPPTNLRALIVGLSKRPEATLQGFFKLAATPRTWSADILSQAVDTAMEIGPATLQAHLRHLQAADLRDGLDTLRVPTLLLHGTLDAVVPWQASAWLAATLPDATSAFHARQGHGLPLLDSAWLAAKIGAFRDATEVDRC